MKKFWILDINFEKNNYGFETKILYFRYNFFIVDKNLQQIDLVFDINLGKNVRWSFDFTQQFLILKISILNTKLCKNLWDVF